MRSSWIMGVSTQSNENCPYKRQIKESYSDRRRRNVIAEMGVMHPQAQECQQAPEAGRVKGQNLS